ncbi:MAG: hypothetical protein M3Y48_07345 [Actinomycetota bacterium]|nr:hypothetical protein [Actinomycetota bacterium]
MLHKGEVAVFEAGFSNPPVNLVGADTVTQLLEVTDERLPARRGSSRSPPR